MPVICEGCGRPVPIPGGYRRNKIQCPCGVICAVPESVRQEADAAPVRPRPTPATKATPAVEEKAERWLLEDEAPAAEQPQEPPRFLDPEPDEQLTPESKPVVAEPRFHCRRCGRLVARQRECPSCDADTIPETSPEPVWWPTVDEPEKTEDEDNTPYGYDGADEVRCPQCSFMLPPGSVLCVRCGFHLKKRKKVAKTYQPIEREWETNYSLQTRLTFLGACEVLSLSLGLLGVFWGGADMGALVGSFLLFTVIMSFLLGTFARIRLTRDARGRTQLTKTWRVCFFALAPKPNDVRGYEGIVSGQHRDVTNMDYIILLVMTLSGLLPGLIWWYLAFYKVTFHVSLCRDHGYAAYLVYSGWDEMQMKEIAFALRDATGLHYGDG